MSSLPVAAEPDPPKHRVQFYGRNDDVLAANVSHYLGEGLQRGEGLVVIATAAHIRAFANRLVEDGQHPTHAIHEGHLVFLGAEETLALFMADGEPDRDSFRSVMGIVLRQLRKKTGGREIRAYGEMVGLLWNAGNFAAAVRLENLWNEMLSEENALQIFCAYQIDVFGKEFQGGAIDEILCAHTHLQREGINGDLHGAVSRAMNEVLGARAKDLPLLAHCRASWAVLPTGETTVLWIRENLPEYADEILARARGYYRPSPPN
jgi:hypothetical protein